MKKLAQVVDQVSKELGLSKNQLSLKIGKSRNYLSEIIRNGVSVEKEQEIISLLLELIDDEVKFLRKQVIELEQEKAQRHLELVHYENGCENMIDNLEATIAEKDEYINKQDGIINNVRDKNKNLEHQITILKKDLDYKEGVINNREARKACPIAHDSRESHMDKVARHNTMLIHSIDELTAELEREKARSASYLNYTDSEIKSEQKKEIDSLSEQLECYANKCRQLRQFVTDDEETIEKLQSKIKKQTIHYYWISAFLLLVCISSIILSIYK